MTVHKKQIPSLRIKLGKERLSENANSFTQFQKMTVLPPHLMHMGIRFGDDLVWVSPQVPHVRGVLLGGGAEDCDCCSVCKTACSSPEKSEMIALEMITLIVQTHVSSY